ncbi:MAG: ferritin-like domain-containing protein [Acetobacteraceae bacterium]
MSAAAPTRPRADAPVAAAADAGNAPASIPLGHIPHAGAAPAGAAPADVAAADWAARHWAWQEPGPLRLGSDAHRDATCGMFRETFNPYRPSVIDWPALSPDALARLVGLPIWNIAVQTEGKARLRMASYARSLADPAWRDAIERNAWEEGRHKEVLSNLVGAYGITLEAEPPYREPDDPEWAYLVTGFSECVDSFFAFGLFELARRSGYFPPGLVDTFEPVIQEEARHILLFANWLAWHRRRLPLWRRAWFEMRVAAVWLFLGWERLSLARGMGAGGDAQADNNFTLNGSRAVGSGNLDLDAVLAVCLAENDRRFAGYDRRLLRPTTTPAIARLLRLRPWRRRHPRQQAATL